MRGPEDVWGLLLVLVAMGLMTMVCVGLMGCATPQERALTRAWEQVCEDAPYHAGEPIEMGTLKAMHRIGWTTSVDMINSKCAR